MKLEKYLELILSFDLSLNEGTSGEYKLYRHVYRPGIKFPFIPANFQAQLLGYEFKEVTLKDDYIYYDLFKGNHRIINNSFSQLFTQYVPYVKAKGRVLLGGFGLGIFAKMLCLKENVESITSIEYSSDIIKLCGSHNKKLKLEEGDFYSYLKNSDISSYDYIFIDTFTDSNDYSVYPEIIIPLRKFLLENYPAIPFDFWSEEEFKAKYIIKHLLNEENKHVLNVHELSN